MKRAARVANGATRVANGAATRGARILNYLGEAKSPLIIGGLIFTYAGYCSYMKGKGFINPVDNIANKIAGKLDERISSLTPKVIVVDRGEITMDQYLSRRSEKISGYSNGLTNEDRVRYDRELVKFYNLNYIKGNDLEKAVITGEDFNNIFSASTVWKAVNDDKPHHGLMYHDGPNGLQKGENFNPLGDSSEGGLYAAVNECILDNLIFGNHICQVKIPSTALVYLEKKSNHSSMSWKIKSTELIIDSDKCFTPDSVKKELSNAFQTGRSLVKSNPQFPVV